VMTPRPGRVAGIHDVAIARPRRVETRADPELGRLTLQIYNELSGAKAQGKAETGVLL
jgi:NitT/TauT family transport system ATP-binding protein